MEKRNLNNNNDNIKIAIEFLESSTFQINITH